MNYDRLKWLCDAWLKDWDGKEETLIGEMELAHLAALANERVKQLQADTELLRAKLSDSISRETVIATELERDDARDAAQFLLENAEDVAAGRCFGLAQAWPWLYDTR